MLWEDLLIGEYTYLSGCFPANPQIALCALCRKRVPSTPKEKVHCEDTTLMYSWCQSTHNRTAPVSTSNCKGSKLTRGDTLQVCLGQFPVASIMEQAGPIVVVGLPTIRHFHVLLTRFFHCRGCTTLEGVHKSGP